MRSERRASQPCREGSDPALVWWRGRYLLAMSKTSGLHWSDNLCDWHFIPGTVLPSEGYGPDLWVRNGELYYVNGAPGGEIFRAVDVDADRWEKVGAIGYLPDPKIFVDESDRTWLYWGSGVNEPLQVVELDSDTFVPIAPPVSLNVPNPEEHGWERSGENNFPIHHALSVLGIAHPDLPDYDVPESYNEGAWMTCRNGIYYLQNSMPATEFNIYCDAISTGSAPAGPFEFQADNPFSLKPGGFITGAGHSCTFQDCHGNWFHLSTMRISRRHIYERRIGLFPVDFYPDGTMYCRTRFGDWPYRIPDSRLTPGCDLFTGWMLLSYRAEAYASSFEPGFEPELAVDENIRTWWAAADGDPRPEWRLQLEKTVELRAIQINFAEHQCLLSGEESPSGCPRFIVETSAEGEPWQLLWDQSENVEDKTHCYYELPFPGQVRRLRIKITAMGNHGRAALSGVRLFGLSKDVPPEIPSKIRIERRKDDPTIADIRWEMPPGAIGVNVLWGTSPERMHHCWQTLEATSLALTSLHARQRYWVSLEAFGPGGTAPLSVPVELPSPL